MDSCLYISKHLHLLKDNIRKDTYNFYTYCKKPICEECLTNKNVYPVIKYHKTKSIKDVSYITGNIVINPSHKKSINKHFYCKKCDLYF